MEQPNLGRIPPQSIEAEQSVLGSMLLDNDILPSVFEILNKEDFYRQDHLEIFSAITFLYKKQKPCDIITVSDLLKFRGFLENIGGLEYLITLTNNVTTTSNARHYAEIVKHKSSLRKIIKMCTDMVDMGYEQHPSDEILNSLQNGMLEISISTTVDTAGSFETATTDAITAIEDRMRNPEAIPGLTTGFKRFDSKINKLQNGDLIIVAARPSMGKTSYAMSIAQHVSLTLQIPTLVFSLEMPSWKLINRMLSSIAEVEANRIKNGTLAPYELSNIKTAGELLKKAKLIIDDRPSLTVMEIVAKAQKEKVKSDIGLIVIDYLQLIKTSSRKESNKNQEISDISYALKVLARQLNVPVIVLSQLSRAPEQRQDHRPILSDLRESGSIEQDADIVVFLYRDEYYNSETEKKGIVDVIISKSRDGEVGTVSLNWVGKYTKFADPEKSIYKQTNIADLPNEEPAGLKPGDLDEEGIDRTMPF